MPQDIIKIKTVTDWLDYNQKLKGATKSNVTLLREYITIKEELSKLAIILFFLKAKLNIEYVRSMLSSAAKQGKYITAVIIGLKVYKVEKKHEPIFKRDIEALYKRLDHIKLIIKEDVRLTEYGAYFEAVGYDILTVDKLPTAEEVEQIGKGNTILDYLESEANKWNEEHPNEVKAHLESIKPELEALAKHKEEVKAKERAEKQAEKERKKALTAEINEMKKNEKAYKSRQKAIDRSFERYYK